MSYYEDFKRTHHRDPSYEEMKQACKRLQAEFDELTEQACDQAGEILAALGYEPQKPAPAKTCGHLREDGRYCGSLAVSGRDYCCFHLQDRGRRLRMARARARRERLPLQLPPLEDLYAVQVGIMQVLDWLLNGKLDRRDAGLALYGLQQAATNLCRPPQVWEESRPFQSDEQMTLPGFEAEHGLPPGFDVNTPPEVAFPEPAAPAASAAEGAEVSEERANLFEVTPLDVELMEIQQREGPEAVARRLKQLDEAEDRRYKRAQKQLAHAQRVVRAAAQNAVREARMQPQSVTAEAKAEAKTADKKDQSA